MGRGPANYTPTCNWGLLISRICKSGMTIQQVANACDVNSNTVRAYINGIATEPRHSLGEKMLAIAKERGVDWTKCK